MTWRTEYVELIPWVRRLRIPRECDAYRPMSDKVDRDPVRRETYRCRNLAYWSFRALPARDRWDAIPSGTFCWNYLISRGIYGSMLEQDRIDKWARNNVDKIAAIKAGRH